MRLKTKELRKDRGWTLEAVADITGLSRSFLSQLETGSRKPSAVTLDLLSQAFHLPIAALIEAHPDRDGSDLPLMIESYCDLLPEDRDNVMRLVLSLRKKAAK